MFEVSSCKWYLVFRERVSNLNSGLVTIAEGFHAYPSRTRPLSPPAPMVLGPQGPGRVGRRQATEEALLIFVSAVLLWFELHQTRSYRTRGPLFAVLMRNRQANGHRRRYSVEMPLKVMGFTPIGSFVSVRSGNSSIFAK